MAVKPPLVKPPLLGYVVPRVCSRWLGDHECGESAVGHVIWDDELENGFVCIEHVRELGTAFLFAWLHKVGPDCGMPGAFFFEQENVCRCEDQPVAEMREIDREIMAC